MKQLFLIQLFLCFAVISYARRGYTITGDVGDFTGPVRLVICETEEIFSEAHDGKFVFEGLLEYPTIAELNAAGLYALILLTNTDITLEADPSAPGGLKVVGSPDTDRNNLYEAYMEKLYEETNEQLSAFYKDENWDGIDSIAAYRSAEIIRIIRENNDSYLGYWRMNRTKGMLDDEQVLELAGEFSDEIKANPDYITFLDKLLKMMAMDQGARYADLEIADVDGNVHRLSDYIGEGKYVLLDFWASWCSPCMVHMPKLCELYQKYHPRGLQIIGISMDTDKERWIRAYTDNQMDWVHLSELIKWKDNKALDAYGVDAIPTAFLIGPDGTIINRSHFPHTLGGLLDSLLDD